MEQTRIREIDASSAEEIALVAGRMRRTLIEVLGEERGVSMYTMEWLEDRVRFHLDPSRCMGCVLLAEATDGKIAGHAIIREESVDGRKIGLFSTFWVEPEYRRRAIATGLLESGERWMRERCLTVAATNTSDANEKLIRLMRRQGYHIALKTDEMVHLTKPL